MPNANATAVQAIKTAAAKYGIDPAAMIAVSRAESGLNPAAIGDGGHAFGLFQFNNAGGVITGQPNPERYLDPNFNAMEAARHIATIKGIKGAHGADAVRMIVSQFERPLKPEPEIQRATSYLSGLQTGVPSPTINSKPPQTTPNGLVGQSNGNTPDNTFNPVQSLLNYAMQGSNPTKQGGQNSNILSILSQTAAEGNDNQVPTPTIGRSNSNTPSVGSPPSSPTPVGAGTVNTQTGPGGTVTVDGKTVNFTPGKTWGGSEQIADQFRNLAETNGLKVMSAKRDRKMTSSGGVSDHWTGSTNSYAFDMSNGTKPTPQMDKYADETAAALGVLDQWKKQGSQGVLNVTKNGYRYQMLYRTDVGGNHYNHVHLGVKKV